MNLDTVLMCAKMAATTQTASLGYVDPDVQALIDELTAAPVEAEAEAVAPEAAAEVPAEVPAQE